MEKLLSEFLTDIFELVAPLRGKKYSDGVRDFHFDMSSALDKYLQPLQLEYHIFAIAPLRDSKLYNRLGNIDLFKISLPDFIQDKRVKMGKVGKVVTIACECNFEGVFSKPLEDYYWEIEKTQIENHWKKCDHELSKCHMELNQAQADFISAKEKLENFLKTKK